MTAGDRTARPGEVSDQDLLVQEAIDAVLAGDGARARDLLNLAVQLDPGHSDAWLWLSGVAEGPAGKAYCLRQVLALESGDGGAGQKRARPAIQAWRQERARLLRQARGGGAGPTVAAAGAQAAETRPAEAPRARLVVRNEFLLIAGLGLVLLALVALGAAGLPSPLLLRLPLGLAFLLFVPGYALQAFLFPRASDLDGPERLALSLGLSVAVVPPLALLLDWLPWGIRLWPVVAGEGLVFALLSALALLRRRRLPATERPVLALGLDVREWWAGQDRGGRILLGLMAGGLLAGVALAAASALLPRPVERFTEFYVLGAEGFTESYPRQAAPGEVLVVTVGIANHEGRAAGYRVEVRAGGEIAGSSPAVVLRNGEVWEAPLSYALREAGEDQMVEFHLYRDGGAEPYRRLRLWIDVVEGGGP